MMDFQIKRSGRRCHSTERELRPGEAFFSELVPEGGEVVRRDYCEEAWNGADDKAMGWWRARIPEIDGGKVYWAPREVMLSYFDSLQQNERLKATAYVMALVLLRKRILQMVDSRIDNESEILELRYPKDNRTFHVTVVDLTPEAATEIQQELADKLFMDQPPE